MCIDAQNGDIGCRVLPQYFGMEFKQVIYLEGYIYGLMDNVRVCEDQTIAGDDEAGTINLKCNAPGRTTTRNMQLKIWESAEILVEGIVQIKRRFSWPHLLQPCDADADNGRSGLRNVCARTGCCSRRNGCSGNVGRSIGEHCGQQERGPQFCGHTLALHMPLHRTSGFDDGGS